MITHHDGRHPSMSNIAYYAADEETLGHQALAALQRRKLSAMLLSVKAGAFYRRKLAGIDFDPARDPMDKLPFTTRAELERDQAEHPPYGTNLTQPLERYVRLHQTSGSSGGRPMRWLDTAANWTWWKRLWSIIYTAAGVTHHDRILFPFSFGPFVGFWSAFESATEMGCLSLSAGGMTTTARLRFMLDNGCTVVCCTPTYALRMAEVAAAEGIDLAAGPVRKLIVAGEPGGSIPSTRRRIEQAWGARVFDHTGMTEIGALGFECEQAPGGVHLIESECIAEVIDPATGNAVPDGEEGELVLTNLGRCDSPLIRYRTNDQVRLTRDKRCACGRWFARMEGGILGRIDDMVVVRGNNVFPGSIESIVRRFESVAEFRIEVLEDGALTQLRVDIEPAPSADPDELAKVVARAIQDALNFRPDLRMVAPGTLPRFEMKARRFVRSRRQIAGANPS
ncbi:MAG: AMP-binding protein [Tepidisphaeraceae bacterium]